MNRKGAISFYMHLTKFETACDSSQTHKATAVWFFTDFVTGPVLVALKGWPDLFSDDVYQHEGTIMTNARIKTAYSDGPQQMPLSPR